MQVDALRKAGVTDDHLHIETMSAASRNRPALDMAIKDLRPGDTLVVWRLDRLARSMRELFTRLEQVREAGASFKSLTESFDFSNAAGQLILGFLGLMAEFERQLTIERTRAGLKALRERGGSLGRAPTMTPAKLLHAERLLKRGKKTKVVAKEFNVAVSTLYSYFIVKTDERGRRHITRKQRD